MYESIGAYDWQAILDLIEAVGWAGVVGIVFLLLMQIKSKLLTKQNKQIIWVVFAAWAIASLGLAAMDAYTYFSSGRDIISESIAQQKMQYGN